MDIVYVGVDISKRTHVAVLLSASLLREVKRLERLPHLTFENSRAGFESACRWMRQHGDAISVLVERTGHYGAALIQFLEEAGCALYVCQPQSRRHDKDDRRDARALAQLLYSQVALSMPEGEQRLQVRPLVQASDVAHRSYALVHHRRELVQAVVRDKNRLTAIADELFPELASICLNPNSTTAIDLREAFPTPAALAEAELSELQALRRRSRPGNATLHQLQLAALTSIGNRNTARVEALTLEQGQLIAQLRLALAQIEQVDGVLAAAMASSREGKILQSMGMGAVQAATLLAGIGSIGNFEDAAHLRGYLGWRPRSVQTGTTMDKSSLTKGGAKYLKQTMYLVTIRAVRYEPWKSLYDRLVPVQARYDTRLGRYRGKMKVIGRVAGQYIRVMYRLLKTDYDLLSSLPPGETAPDPMLYDASRHNAAMKRGARTEQHDTPPSSDRRPAPELELADESTSRHGDEDRSL